MAGGPPHTYPIGGGGGPGRPKKGVSELQEFLWAEGEQESSNNYDAENAETGALGRWQVLPSNLPAWLPASGQPDMSPAQFLANHRAQNAVALHILGGYYKQYGPAGAAAMWYSGEPDPDATYGDPPVYQYVDDVLQLMNNPNVGTITSTGTSYELPWQAPSPTKGDSWAQQIINTGHIARDIGRNADAHARMIDSTYSRERIP
jgi:hypothetical protein